jgi:uncharacterized protein (DUF1015 family)
MAILKPFCGVRPPKSIAHLVASRPYDVLNSNEARAEAAGNEKSLLRLIKPEINFTPAIDEHESAVYARAAEMFALFQSNGWLVQDDRENYYIYAQTMNGIRQYGLVGCAGVQDYVDGVIRKHELTRPDKEEDRMKHVRITNANLEPVFFTYRAVPEIDQIVASWVAGHEPVYDFTSSDDIGHHFWVIDSEPVISQITGLFAKIPCTYVADGHHRTAAAALVGNEHKLANPGHNGTEEYNFFLAVHFPDNQLRIIDYNRVVKDLNGLTVDELLDRLSETFTVSKTGTAIHKPCCLHNFGLYVDGNWYSLTAKPGTCSDDDPIGVLDVTISSNLILRDILGINDLRTDKRIDFVGGIRGLGELQKRVDSGEMALALALYPVSMKQLMDIADTGNIMPPKTTWFEPKLRSGLVIHKLS